MNSKPTQKENPRTSFKSHWNPTISQNWIGEVEKKGEIERRKREQTYRKLKEITDTHPLSFIGNSSSSTQQFDSQFRSSSRNNISTFIGINNARAGKLQSSSDKEHNTHQRNLRSSLQISDIRTWSPIFILKQNNPLCIEVGARWIANAVVQFFLRRHEFCSFASKHECPLLLVFRPISCGTLSREALFRWCALCIGGCAGRIVWIGSWSFLENLGTRFFLDKVWALDSRSWTISAHKPHSNPLYTPFSGSWPQGPCS